MVPRRMRVSPSPEREARCRPSGCGRPRGSSEPTPRRGSFRFFSTVHPPDLEHSTRSCPVPFARSLDACLRHKDPCGNPGDDVPLASRRCNSPANYWFVRRRPPSERRERAPRRSSRCSRRVWRYRRLRFGAGPPTGHPQQWFRRHAATRSAPVRTACGYGPTRRHGRLRLASSAAAASRAIPASAPAILAARCPPVSNICANPISTWDRRRCRHRLRPQFAGRD